MKLLLHGLALVVVITPALSVNNGPQDHSDSKAPAEARTTTAFKAKAQLVQVDVTVKDSDGKPIVGLQAADFTVLENGKPQEIRVFEPHTPASKSVIATPPPSLPPHTYTNQLPVAVEGPLSILLLDLSNTPLNDQTSARKLTIEFLKSVPRGKTMAMFVFGKRLSMVQGFTNDPQLMVAAAEKVLNDQSVLLTTESERQQVAGSTESIARAAVADIDTSKNRPGAHELTPAELSNVKTGGSLDYGAGLTRERTNALIEAKRTRERVTNTLNALSALARSVSSYPGRKNLVWLSGGFPIILKPSGIDFERMNLGSRSDTARLEVTDDFKAAIRSTTDALAAARIAVYPIDVRGTQTAGVDIALSAADTAKVSSVDNPKGYTENLNTQAGIRLEERSAMKEVAEDTGGEVLAGNDVRDSIDRAIDDGASYYALAYTPDRTESSEEFRKIDVRVNRAGLKLAYRPGYFPDAQPEGIRPKTHPLILALQPGVPASGVIPLTVEVLPPDDTSRKVRINSTIDIRGIDFAEVAGNRMRAVFDCIAVAFTREGNAAGQASNTIDVTLSRPEYETALRTGLTISQQMDLPPGDYNVRFGVMNHESQKIGTVDAPLAVAAGK